MAGYVARIRTAAESPDAGDPTKLSVKHHRTEYAQIETEVLSGGHLLHLALAGCLFNDILYLAKQRGITVTDLEVSADGGFAGEPTVSTGITYSVRITGDGPETELADLVASAEADAAIGHALRRGMPVTSGHIEVRGRG